MPLFHTSTIGQFDDSSTATTINSVASAITSEVLLAANTDRKGATFTNQGTAILYLALAATSTTAAYTAKLQADDYYELPYHYTGIVSGIWSSANGNAIITELT